MQSILPSIYWLIDCLISDPACCWSFGRILLRLHHVSSLPSSSNEQCVRRFGNVFMYAIVFVNDLAWLTQSTTIQFSVCVRLLWNIPRSFKLNEKASSNNNNNNSNVLVSGLWAPGGWCDGAGHYGSAGATSAMKSRATSRNLYPAISSSYWQPAPASSPYLVPGIYLFIHL